MSKEQKGVVSFSIDDTPPLQKSAKSDQLDFCEFLDQPIKDTAENLSFSNKSVKKAGRKLRKNEGDLKQATALIQAFRAAHERPLDTISYLIGRCCRELQIPIKLVKRLKRLETIIDKLQRKTLNGQQTNQTCVTNMNDIGGCRAIFPNMESLELVRKRLTKTPKGKTCVRIKDIDDYIRQPKYNNCGYRSLHIIYQYEHSVGKKFKIEAQLRTELQHLWATTVEIVDILERTKIKTHSHNPDSEKCPKQVSWEELLSIMSKYIADLEGTIQLSETDKISYAKKLKKLDKKLSAVDRLKLFKIISKKIEAESGSAKDHVILIVDEKSLKVIGQKVFDNQARAIIVFNNIEKMTASLDNINTLLVSTKNLDQLADAYPNYIGDCASFIEILREAMNYKKAATT